MLKKYIDEEQFDYSSSSPFGKKQRHNSSTSLAIGGEILGNGNNEQSFNIKNMDEEEERDLRRYEIQCELNIQGASDLVVDLFMNDITNKVFKETVLLSIALLEGGNTQVQV